MPPAAPIVAAVAGGLASAGAASVIGGTILGPAFLASAASSIFGGVVSFGINAAFGARPKRPAEQPLAAVAAGRTEELVSPLAPHRVILGRALVSGVLVFVATRDSGGRPNALLYQVVVIAGHKVRSISQIRLNDEFLSDVKFQAVARVEWALGTPTQAALPTLLAEIGSDWTAEHRARGRAIIGAKITYDESVFRAGRPQIKALVEGRDDILDPRTGLRGWTDNPALIAAWFLTWEGGYRVPEEKIDWASVIEAANVCDELVPLRTGGTEKRYTCNGAFTRDVERADVLTGILGAMGGSAARGLDGRWYIRAGAWRPTARAIDEDWLAGPVSVLANRPARDLFNGVRATYIRPQANWQPVDAPPLLDAAALAADGGDEVYEDLELAYTTSGTMAQRLMRLALNRNRAGRRVTLTCTLRALVLVPGDTVTLRLPRLAESTWRIVERAVADDARAVTVVLEEDRPELYAWSIEDEKPLSTSQDVTLPDGALIGQPTLTVTAPTAPVPASIATSWTSVSDAASYDLAWRGPSDTAWTVTSQAGTSASITTGGRAAFRVRARRADGTLGNWDEAPFPAALTDWQAFGTATGYVATYQRAGAVQVFASAGGSFSAATLATPAATSAGRVEVNATAGALNVWLRPVSPKGVVGPEVGPIAITAGTESSGDGGSTGAPGEGGGGEGGGEGGGADGGADGGDGGSL